MTMRKLLLAAALCLVPGLAGGGLLQMPFTVAGGGGTAPSGGSAPNLTGTAAYPSTLTCNHVGSWAGSPTPTLTYQFFQDTSTSVQGPASGTTYAVASTDQGHTITCKEIASNTAGSATSAASNGISIPAATCSGAQWNTADADPAITLSGSPCKLVASQSSTTGAYKSVRATAPTYATSTNHKVVATMTLTAASANTLSGDGQVLGVLGNTGSNVLSSHIGVGTPGMGFNGGQGGDFQNGASPVFHCSGTSPPVADFAQGDTIWLAIDFNTGNIWCSKTCTTWFASGTPDGGSGQSETLTTGTYFLGWSGARFGGVTDTVTLNPAPSLAGCTGLTTFHTWNSG